MEAAEEILMAEANSPGQTRKSPWSWLVIVFVILVLGFLFFVLSSDRLRHEYLNRSAQPNAPRTPNPPAMSP
jgi:hypothetical protein